MKDRLLMAGYFLLAAITSPISLILLFLPIDTKYSGYFYNKMFRYMDKITDKEND